MVEIYGIESVITQLGNPRYGYDDAQAREWIAGRQVEVDEFLADVEAGRPPGPLPLIIRTIDETGRSLYIGSTGVFRSDYRELRRDEGRDALTAANTARPKGDPEIHVDAGDGIMSAVVSFLMSRLWIPICNVRRMIGTVIVGNIGSRRVLQKSGFVYRGDGAPFPFPLRDGTIVPKDLEIFDWSAPEELPVAGSSKDRNTFAADGLHQELCRETRLGKLLEAEGGGFHESLFYDRGEFGLSIRTNADLPKGACIVRCPVKLVVSPKSAIIALEAIASHAGANIAAVEDLTDHEAICGYLALHHPSPLVGGFDHHDLLSHHDYVERLPGRHELRTPCWWTRDEVDMLAGTNMHGSVLDRMAEWKKEWRSVAAALGSPKMAPLEWKDYLWACTMVSSRAFPSSLVGPVPRSEIASSSIHRERTATFDADGMVESTPILLPGMDAFNHQRGRPVQWYGSGRDLSVVIESTSGEGGEVFNNYGAKSTEEYIFGYGFAIDGIDNADDHVVLKVSPRVSQGHETQQPILSDPRLQVHYVKRDGKIPPFLLARLRASYAEPEDLAQVTAPEDLLGEAPFGWDFEEVVLRTLKKMLEAKLQGVLNDPDEPLARTDVHRMVNIYRRGQRVILGKALEKATTMHETAEMHLKEMYGSEDDGSNDEIDYADEE